jgi:ribonuclease HII
MAATDASQASGGRVSTRAIIPSLQWERSLWRSGLVSVAGLDEVGRGPLAGPLVAAAVVLPPRTRWSGWLRDVRDSKLLSARQREALDLRIRVFAVGYGVGVVSHEELDVIGITAATRRAMHDALLQLSAIPEHLLIDALSLPEPNVPQTSLIHGDARCVSIACASIVAKVARDAMMVELDGHYPGYGFLHNMGYCTAEHLQALDRLGPCPIHRRSFAPVRLALGLDP